MARNGSKLTYKPFLSSSKVWSPNRSYLKEDMDLVVGVLQQPDASDDYPTCVFAANYNETVLSKRAFTNLRGEEIKILSVFLGRGLCMREVHTSLQERQLACKIIGWFQATPGQITDEVHFLLNPKSSANTFCRSIDKLSDRAQIKDNVFAEEPIKPKPHDGKQFNDGRKPRTRARKPTKPVHCA